MTAQIIFNLIKKLFLTSSAIVLTSLLLTSCKQAPAQNARAVEIVPVPASVKEQAGQFELTNKTQIVTK